MSFRIHRGMFRMDSCPDRQALCRTECPSFAFRRLYPDRAPLYMGSLMGYPMGSPDSRLKFRMEFPGIPGTFRMASLAAFRTAPGIPETIRIVPPDIRETYRIALPDIRETCRMVPRTPETFQMGLPDIPGTFRGPYPRTTIWIVLHRSFRFPHCLPIWISPFDTYIRFQPNAIV